MKKKVTAVLLTLLILVPAFAVLNEKNLSQTLSVLRYELRSAYRSNEQRAKRMRGNGDRQHARLVKMMQQSNELSLMLYSQKQDYTFDMTYALNEVSRQYEEFASRKMPFDDILTRLDIDIDRYNRLIHTLRSIPPTDAVEYVDSLGNVVSLGFGRPRAGMPNRPRPAGAPERRERPFQLDSLGQIDRDSCIFYAESLMESSLRQKERLVRDSTHYTETASMLKSAYDYAQMRYRSVQTKIFKDGQTDYVTLVKGFSRYWHLAMSDWRDKYSLKDQENIRSQWRGPMVVGFSLFVLFWLVVSLLVSIVLVNILSRKVEFFKRDRLLKNKFTTTLIFGVMIFAISIMLASTFSKQNFMHMASQIVGEFAWMLAAILISLIIRLDEDNVRKGIELYLPTMLMCLIIITFRIIFIPNSLINIIFPPILLLFTIWQGFTLGHFRKALPQWDMVFGWVSMVMMVATTLVAFSGYVLLGVQLLIWWFFQLTLLQTVVAVYDVLNIYYKRHIHAAKSSFISDHPELPHKTDEDMIAVTWPHAFFKKALLPVAVVLSIPVSLLLASGVFDLTGVFSEAARYPFLNVEGYISLSLYKIIEVIALYFVFNFLNYLAKAVFRQMRIRKLLRASSGKMINENQLNFTLTEHVIGISLWSIYIITIFVTLRIPTAAIKVIGAGLATGLGFAMKDILNNFFYGVQLMGGRLRVGDFIECEGVRGKVDSINYQSTQIVASDGSVMAFPNSSLFNKNFKNLTKNHSYEMLSFTVGVNYGSDVDQVRQIILEALQPLNKDDKYGRPIVDPSFGIQVRFQDFGDNSVNLQVIVFTTVEEHFTYAARAKECIYNALNGHGIEIPFPQRDLYIQAMPRED